MLVCSASSNPHLLSPLHPCPLSLPLVLSLCSCPVSAPLQRATITVHDGKILVKTEVVKAIITADKAVLIKGR
jgi:hypothetical protein